MTGPPPIEEPPAYSIRRFKATLHKRIDDARTIAVTRYGKTVGHYIPVGTPPAEPGPVEPEADEEPDDDRADVVRITTGGGSRFEVIRQVEHLSLPELFGDGD
jgi:hypothetical protein